MLRRITGIALSAGLLAGCSLFGVAEQHNSQCSLLPDASCVGADLRGRDLSGLDLSRVDFRGANLSGADFAGSSLWLTNFAGANLTGADFSGALAIEAYFDDADLRNARFDEARLSSVSFVESSLTGASFRAAQLTLTDVTNSAGAQLDEAVLCDVYDGENIRGGVCDPDADYETNVPAASGEASEKYDPATTIDDILGSVFEVVTPLVARNLSSDPVKAARIYAYVGVAASVAARDSVYEGLLLAKGVHPAPPDSQYTDVAVAAAATAAALFMLESRGSRHTRPELYADDVFKKVLYHPRDSVVASLVGADSVKLHNSLLWGTRVGHAVAKELAPQDGVDSAVKQIPATSLVEDALLWEPAPPSYQPPLAPAWGALTPLFVGSEKCALPGPFAAEGRESAKNSLIEALSEVVAISQNSSVDEKSMARFWDDSVGSSATPSGHWIGIARIAIRDRLDTRRSPLSTSQITRVYTDMAVAMHNTAIATWGEKYKWNIVRPVTLRNRLVAEGLDKTVGDWKPYLASPPHPEYPSGHAAISSAAASVLEKYLGTVSFTDPGINLELQSTDNLNVLPRTFKTFRDAADEAAYSRVVGGIHFRFSERAGADLGNCVAASLLSATVP